MSYDLMVFDPACAPRDREAFCAWFQEQTQWAEDHSYDDVAVATAALRRWYDCIRQSYPALNGPEAVADNEVTDRTTDYCIGRNVIYAGFSWVCAEEVYPEVRRLAVECEVGFYDVSGDEGDGEIYFPGDTLRPESNGNWRKVAKQFRDLRNGN